MAEHETNLAEERQQQATLQEGWDFLRLVLQVSCFEEYEASSEEWGVCQERLEQFFVANGIVHEDVHRMCTILLKSCGKAYHLIHSLAAQN